MTFCVFICNTTFFRFSHTYRFFAVISVHCAALNAGRSTLHVIRRKLSVRLSDVRLSNVWIATKRKKVLSRFLYHTKDHLA